MIERGEGTELVDSEGRRYIDGVSSLWCNVHGHRHPLIDQAVREQLDRVAHSTMLGLTHRGAAELAARLVELAPPGLSRVFYSDSGSSATEIALKMAFQYWQQRGGQHRRRTSFVCLRDAYHGDTLGAVSVGGIDLFHAAYSPLLFQAHRVEPGDAGQLERVLDFHAEEIAAVIIEPLVQGAAGIRVHPPGYLRQVRELTERHDVLLICDEVATGFGRTGTMFACEQERVAPDFLCLGKGLTGGYLPLAATLTTERVYEGFLGAPEEGRTFFHGHTFTGNPLACAAALANLDAFECEGTLVRLQPKIRLLGELLARGGEAARGRRGARAGLHGRHRPRRARPGASARPPGGARGAPARGDRSPPRRRRRPDAAADDSKARPPAPGRDRRRLDPGRLRLRLRREAGRRPRPGRLSPSPVRLRVAPGPAGPILGVMKAVPARSRGVNETVAAAATEIPTDADVAFEELYRRDRDDVHAYVAGLLRDRSAAEDVTALAFERAYRRRRSFNPKRGTRRAWLFGIARNAALDELRRRRRQATLVAEPVDEAAIRARAGRRGGDPPRGAARGDRLAGAARARAGGAQVLRRPHQPRDRRA